MRDRREEEIPTRMRQRPMKGSSTRKIRMLCQYFHFTFISMQCYQVNKHTYIDLPGDFDHEHETLIMRSLCRERCLCEMVRRMLVFVRFGQFPRLQGRVNAILHAGGGFEVKRPTPSTPTPFLCATLPSHQSLSYDISIPDKTSLPPFEPAILP